jgi:hypothetical protein
MAGRHFVATQAERHPSMRPDLGLLLLRTLELRYDAVAP